MSWNLPSHDARVEYNLWTTPSDLVTRDFFQSFKKIAEALGDRAYFTPHMYIYDGIRSQCQGNSGQSYCKNLCTNNGRYCSTAPNDVHGVVSGADVVRESLRRMCIWENYGKADGIGTKWWDYVATFNERCTTSPEYFTDQECIQNVYSIAKIDRKGIEQCMDDSGDTAYDRTNVILDAELIAQSQQGAVVIPTAFVNSVAMRSELNVENVLSAICSRYVNGSKPKVCRRCAGCSDVISCVKYGICGLGRIEQKTNGYGMSASFIIILLLLVTCFVAVLFGVWVYKQQDRGLLTKYLLLEDDDDEHTSGKSWCRWFLKVRTN
jgi:hypothetical protein